MPYCKHFCSIKRSEIAPLLIYDIYYILYYLKLLYIEVQNADKKKVCNRKIRLQTEGERETSRKRDKFRILRVGAVLSTCYETVHCTVSPKFTCEFGATCLLCFAQFTPPSKIRKAPKMARTRCPCHFSNPSECNKLHPPPFAREAKRFIYSGSPKSVSFLGIGERNGVFIINFLKIYSNTEFLSTWRVFAALSKSLF